MTPQKSSFDGITDDGTYIYIVLRHFLIGVILFSMMLHGAARLGVLSYAYEQRHEIAFALGLIDEIPITTCSHEYFADGNLTLHEIDQESQNAVPAVVFTAQEIHLFMNTYSALPAPPAPTGLAALHHTGIVPSEYHSPALSIFHPPC